MALDTAFYLVTKEIAIRSGLVNARYRTLDNRFILDNKDLSRVRFSTDEYINGLDGVEKISESQAKTLIAQGGYKKGLAVEAVSAPAQENTESTPTETPEEQEAEVNETPVEETTEESTEESPEEEEETSEEAPTEEVNEEETETYEEEKEEE